MSILFKREHVPLILDGTKTQTRRTGRRRWTEGTTQWAKTGFRRDDRFALLRIKRVWQEPLGAISWADAKAEGYESPLRYVQAFARINRTTLSFEVMNTVVWAVEFEVVDEPRVRGL